LEACCSADDLFFFILFYSFSFFFILFSIKLEQLILFFKSLYFKDRHLYSFYFFPYKNIFKFIILKSKFLMVYVVNEPTMNQRFSY